MDRNFYYADKDADWVLSLSARRAWIEILIALPETLNFTMSLSARRAWIEITEVSGSNQAIIRSLSARRAWIEMQVFQRIAKPFRVALRKESVDRNIPSH